MREDPLRTLLFVPGSRPDRIEKARGLGADGVILELEDGVALTEKDRARAAVHAALENRDFGRSKVLCRINDWSSGLTLADLDAVYDRVAGIILPKSESPEDVVRFCDAIEERTGHAGTGTEPFVFALIESPAGVLSARQIATAHPRVQGLVFGSEDFAASLGVFRTTTGTELALARALLALAASAAGVTAIDTVWLDLDDPDGLYQDTLESIQLGFRGRLVVHPKQIEVVRRAFTPTEDRVEWARRIVEAWDAAVARGEGVFALDRKIVDRPVLFQAQRVLRYHELGTRE